MSKHIVEETPAKGSHAQGDNPVEKQASQLAYDVKYKVKQQLNKGTKLNPAQVAKAYMAQLAKSPAPPAVKALAKKKLIGEEHTSDVASLAEKAMVNAMVKVFVEGVTVEKVEVEVQEEVKEKQYKIRVTDKKTGNTYVRMASRAKIAELRANPNISSVEMTGYGQISGDEKSKGRQTAAAKAGKDYDGDGKVESGAKEYRGAVHNAIQRKKGLKPDGKDTSSVKEEIIYEKEGDIPEKKITGKGVNNSKRVKVFPNSMSEQAPMVDKPDPAQKRREQQNDRARQQEVQILQKKLQALRSSPKGSDPSIMASYEAEGEVVEQKDVVRYCPKCDKDETREECRYGGEYWDENSKPAKGEDARELPTKMDLFKNKLRARGIKVAGITPAPRNMKTYDDLGEGMTMKDFKKQRSRQKQKEKRADEKTSPLRRAGIHADKASPERAARHRANVDPDFDYGPAADERNYPGGKLRPNKVRKAKALGELGESAVDRAEYEKIAKEPAPKDDKKAAYAFKDNKDRQRDLKKLARLVRHADGQRRNPAMYNSFEPEGEMAESAEDRARDEHQMRGGMAARVDYDRPPAKKLSNAELGIKPGKTWVQKQMEKKKQEKK
jgi:hypothetical protein